MLPQTGTPSKDDLCIMRRMQQPPTPIKAALSATIAVLGYNKLDADNWKFVRKVLLHSDRLMIQMSIFNPKKLKPENARYAKEKLAPYTRDHMRNASAAVLYFYNWVIDAVNNGAQSQ